MGGVGRWRWGGAWVCGGSSSGSCSGEEMAGLRRGWFGLEGLWPVSGVSVALWQSGQVSCLT